MVIDLQELAAQTIQFEKEATERGIPDSELRFVLGFCIGRLLAGGASPDVLKWYLCECVDRIQSEGADLQKRLSSVEGSGQEVPS